MVVRCSEGVDAAGGERPPPPQQIMDCTPTEWPESPRGFVFVVHAAVGGAIELVGLQLWSDAASGTVSVSGGVHNRWPATRLVVDTFSRLLLPLASRLSSLSPLASLTSQPLPLASRLSRLSRLSPLASRLSPLASGSSPLASLASHLSPLAALHPSQADLLLEQCEVYNTGAGGPASARPGWAKVRGSP